MTWQLLPITRMWLNHPPLHWRNFDEPQNRLILLLFEASHEDNPWLVDLCQEKIPLNYSWDCCIYIVGWLVVEVIASVFVSRLNFQDVCYITSASLKEYLEKLWIWIMIAYLFSLIACRSSGAWMSYQRFELVSAHMHTGMESWNPFSTSIMASKGLPSFLRKIATKLFSTQWTSKWKNSQRTWVML